MDTFQRAQRPIVHSYIPPFPGHTVCIDIFAIGEESQLTIWFFAFMLCAREAGGGSEIKKPPPSSILDVIIRQWIYCYGRMSIIVTDQGPGFIGESWVRVFRKLELQTDYDSYSCSS